MAPQPPSWFKRWSRWLALAGLLPVGCALSPAPTPRPTAVRHGPDLPAMARLLPPEDDEIQLVSVPGSSFPPGPLSLDRLVTLATENHPDLAIAHARAMAARGRLVQAGLYPNPILGWEADDVGAGESAAGTQGPMIIQEFVTGGKLELAQAAATQGVAVADWQAISRRYELITRVRLAYFEVLTAQQDVRENQFLVGLAEEGLEVARAAKRVGTGAEPDVLRAEIELNQSRLGLSIAQERAEAAWKLLAAAVGLPALPSASLEEVGPEQVRQVELARAAERVISAGAWTCQPLASLPFNLSFALAVAFQQPKSVLERPAPVFAWQTVLGDVLARSAEVQAAQAAFLQAEQEVLRAQAENIPNVHVLVRPFYSFPEQELQAKIEAGVTLPIFNRNQGNIMAAQAEVARAADENRQVELRLTERLTQAFERYQNAQRQVETYEKEILPRAGESLRLIRVGYQAGDAKFDYTTVLEAQRTEARARLALLGAHRELWRAVSEIAGLLQLDTLTPQALVK